MAPKVFDRYGNEKSWEWLVEHYGPVVVHPANPGGGWRCIELHENADLAGGAKATPHIGTVFNGIMAASVIMVHFQNADGSPFQGHRVAWYWPDAPDDANCGPVNGVPDGMQPNRSAKPGETNMNGDVGFGMGGGAYYFPPNIGPHAVWAYGNEVNSDVVFGLGMLGGTNHNSLWPVFQWDEGEEPPEPPPANGCDLTPVLEAIARLDSKVDYLVDLARMPRTIGGVG